MSDLISRQAAIDIERNATVDTNPSHFEAHQKFMQFMDDAEISSFGRWQWSNGFNTALTAVGIDLKNLPSVQPEPQWIPCSERLPEEKDAGILKKLGTKKRSEYVLATVEVKGERMTVTACTYDGKWHWDKKYAFPDFKVTAWMPLPEPYKGGEDE